MSQAGLHPAAVGGVGGSGTRVVANLLRSFGYYIGDALTDSLDNEWFMLLFKQRSILLASEADFARRLDMFVARMSGERRLTEEERNWIAQLADQSLLQQPQEWRAGIVASLLDDVSSRTPGQPWGWKEPNTHILLGRLLAAMPALRYIHVVRDPLYMTASGNQNQLALWGPVFLDRDVATESAVSLAYWCAAHRRLVDLMAGFPGRILIVDYDKLCTKLIYQVGRIAGFLDASMADGELVAFMEWLVHTPSDEARATVDLDQFDAGDLAYIASLGYST